MEIDITRFFNECEPSDFSASRMERGDNAAKETWNAAKEEGADKPLLNTSDELDAMRKWAKETGAWNKEEIAAWSDEELNALFIQLVSGDMREADLSPNMTDKQWRDYARRQERGEVSGSIYGGPLVCSEHAGKVFFGLY